MESTDSKCEHLVKVNLGKCSCNNGCGQKLTDGICVDLERSCMLCDDFNTKLGKCKWSK